jgi:hypothetical protein
MAHDKGPYGGNHDRFMKFTHKLTSDDPAQIMLLLAFLRTQMTAAGFHSAALIPDLMLLHPHVDLTRSPVDASCMSNRDHPSELVATVLGKDWPTRLKTAGNGFLILNALFRLHFPHVHGTRAPDFNDALRKKIAQAHHESIDKYDNHFTMWLQRLCLYREFCRYQDSEVTIWFIDGLLDAHKTFLNQEYTNLKMFHSRHRLDNQEPPLPLELQRYNLCERLRVSLPTATPTPRPSPSGAQVSAIDQLAADELATVAAVRGPPAKRNGFIIDKPAPCTFAPCAGHSSRQSLLASSWFAD